MTNNSFNKTYPFKSSFADLDTLYGEIFTVNEDDFVELGMIGWRKIGNRPGSWFRYKGRLKDNVLELPCNVDRVDAVATQRSYCDQKRITMIPVRRRIKSTIKQLMGIPDGRRYVEGEFIEYSFKETLDGENYVEVHMPDGTPIEVVYRGLHVDDEGLPLLNEKESEAIATYVAMTMMQRKWMSTRDNAYQQMWVSLKSDWNNLVKQARVPLQLSQNTRDMLLNEQTRMVRKQHGISFKFGRR